jgi:hypothetical protein
VSLFDRVNPPPDDRGRGDADHADGTDKRGSTSTEWLKQKPEYFVFFVLVFVFGSSGKKSVAVIPGPYQRASA